MLLYLISKDFRVHETMRPLSFLPAFHRFRIESFLTLSLKLHKALYLYEDLDALEVIGSLFNSNILKNKYN